MRAMDQYTLTCLRLESDEIFRVAFPHLFGAELTVSIGGNRLDIELEIENLDRHGFSFTCALHTYLRVAEIENCSLEGLQETTFRDQLQSGAEFVQSEPSLAVEGEIDRIYFDVPDTLVLREPHRALAIQTEGFSDAVVWNPWQEKCSALDDMEADAFRRMLCVEAAQIHRPPMLEPGESWQGRQSLIAA